ncbi:hypothetical protein F5Y03DRAFT_402113 [Xylaria venustula]|nr:hypothetical protein F5Y03DRAFT_402113 [Xylaria venustula]
MLALVVCVLHPPATPPPAPRRNAYLANGMAWALDDNSSGTERKRGAAAAAKKPIRTGLYINPRSFRAFQAALKFKQLGSKPIRFLVGREKEEFHLNSGFLSPLSQSLDDIVRNNIAESSQSCIIWEDVDSIAFLCFAEFAYTGHYSCPMPTEQGKNNASLEPANISAMDAFALPYSLMSYNSASQNMHGTSAFHNGGNGGEKRTCGCCPSQKTQYFISAFLYQYCGSEGTGTYPTQNYEAGSVEHLIGHVQLWVIANKYAVTLLMDKATSELAGKLAKCAVVASAFMPQFRQLVCYLYTNTPGHCQLRHVVASFAVCVARDVSALEGWETSLEDVPDFARDLTSATYYRPTPHVAHPSTSHRLSLSMSNNSLSFYP